MEWGMNKLFVSGCLPDAPINQRTANTLYSKYACFLEPLGDIAKRISHLTPAQKNALQSPNFTSGQISLLSGLIAPTRFGVA
jgi:hypothetical protein